MNLENILSDRRQTQKATCCYMIYFYEASRIVQTIGRKSRLMVTRDLGERNGEWLPNGYGVSLCSIENVLN